MTTLKTSELIDDALDWAVCLALGRTDMRIDPDDGEMMASDDFDYSTDWSQGGPIIEREGISINAHLDGNEWFARDYWGLNEQAAERPLEAAMRCYVASKLGDTVDVPPELV